MPRFRKREQILSTLLGGWPSISTITAPARDRGLDPDPTDRQRRQVRGKFEVEQILLDCPGLEALRLHRFFKFPEACALRSIATPVETAAPQVLLVDDDQDLCESLAEGLARERIRAAYVTSAQAALLRLVAEPGIEIVVTDLVMPGISGLEFLRKLSVIRRRRPLAAIVMTGSPSVDSAVTSLRLSAVEFLQKPVEAEEIARAVRDAAARLEEAPRLGGFRQAPMSYPGLLAQLRRLQQGRAGAFPASVLNEACWNMLLLLAEAELEGRVLTSAELYAGSGASPTTGFRRLEDLDEAGLIVRTGDLEDRRRVIVQLTPKGSLQIRSLIAGTPGARDPEAPEGNDAVERSASA